MKTPLLHCLAALAFATAAFANALETTPAKSTVPEALPAGARIVRLEVLPTTLALAGKYESAQIIVTARLASGDAADVTRIATYQLDGGVAEIGSTGMVKPTKNGTGTLRITLGEQKSEVPVTVTEVRVDPPVDFIRDVNPVMTKAGCNAGACHGAKDGKYGFKLSLRGYDPIFDVRSLKDDLASRRLNAAQPDDSLMLLKATSGVPHEGGQRFKMGDKYYEIMRAWIADGAKLDLKAPRVTGIEVFPKDPVVQQIGSRQQVRVVATYSDGRRRDVTAEAFVESGNMDVAKANDGGLVETLRRGEAPLLARYEGNYAATTLTVMGDRTGFAWQPPETWSRIDELVAAKWERMKIAPSGVCDDTTFLRRAHLDLTGLPPSPEDVRAFLADPQPLREKRGALVDRLIGSPDFIEHWTNKWSDMLQVNAKFLGVEGARLFRGWIRQQVEANTPYDQFVQRVVTATGSTRENPAASYWKILREPAEAMENTTHLFLATRFNCNKCHDHPFERWTQDQYYQLGAFFAQVELKPDPASGRQVILGTAVEKARPLYEIVSDAATGDMIHDRTRKVAEPGFPYRATTEPKGARRQQLAEWMTSPDNRYFASSYANRIWGYLTGAGLIEPLDDIRAGNPPSNPELLDYLTKEFVGSKFDVRHLMRIITKSRTYQLSIATNRWNEDDRTNYSHALARRLPAEVLYDSVLKVTGSGTKLPGGMRAGLTDGGTDLPSGFLANLGRPARESACECERSNDLQLGGVMALLSGPAVGDAIGDTKNSLAKLVAEQTDDGRLVDEVFLRVLNRSAQEPEVKRVLASWQTIAPEHKALNAELTVKEAEQAPLIAKMESERGAATATAKTELTRYEGEIAPKVAEAEKMRVTDAAAAEVAVKAYEKDKLPAAAATFESTVPVARTHTGWQMLDPVDLRATNLATLSKQPDGSIKAGPERPQNSDYIISADTKVAGITGILLEVLPSADEPSFGPGRAAGNFVLGEFSVKVGDYRANPATDVEFSGAIADFAQAKFEVKDAIDGKKNDAKNGWAIGNQPGVPHFAAFALKKPLGTDKGSRLRVELNQPRTGSFTLGRFRLWITTSAQPLNIGLPLAVAEALRKPAPARSKAEQAAIGAYWKEADPALSKLRLASGKLQLPLPPDPGVLERRAALARAEEPIRLDPKLVQLRQDAQQSTLLMANHRLTAVQDLTWALINTPAFLFNH